MPGGDHHYTTSASERDDLVAVGWSYEGVGWFSSDTQDVPVYRQYNPYAKTGTHNYTTDAEENDYLVSLGWRAEGIGWYGAPEGNPNLVPPVIITHIEISNVRTSIALGESIQVQAVASISGSTGPLEVVSERWAYQTGGAPDFNRTVFVYTDQYSHYSASNTFMEPGTYEFGCLITHPAGYYFASDLVITLNGQEYEGFAQMNYMPEGPATAIYPVYQLTIE